MKFISQLFKIILIYIVLLVIILGGILYLRPDIKYQDFINDKQYWAIPLALLYIVFNFRNMFRSIINKIIILGLMSWGAYQFFPQYAGTFFSYLGKNTPNYDTITGKANELMTPKDGSDPKFQIENKKQPLNNLNLPKDLNKDAYIEPNKKDKTNSTDISKKEKNIVDSVENITKDPTKILPEMVDNIPPEIQDKLKSTGIDITNPKKTIENLGNKSNNRANDLIK